jgi:hypothetical protein
MTFASLSIQRNIFCLRGNNYFDKMQALLDLRWRNGLGIPSVFFNYITDRINYLFYSQV